jgi:hypothetical protein
MILTIAHFEKGYGLSCRSVFRQLAEAQISAIPNVEKLHSDPDRVDNRNRFWTNNPRKSYA